MHPLSDNLKDQSFEELEKRKAEIMKRFQIMRRSGITNPLMWSQLEALLDAILDEQQERFKTLSDSSAPDVVVVNTDPLEDDPTPLKDQPRNNRFNPVS